MPTTSESESKLTREEQNFAQEVRRRREAQGWRLDELAEAMRDRGVAYMNKSAVSRIENGKRPVRMIEAQALTRVFGTSLVEMTNPDGREVFLTFADHNHGAMRKSFVAFKDSVENFARMQKQAEGQIEHLSETFQDRDSLDTDTQDRLDGLLHNLRQLSGISILDESAKIVEHVSNERG